MEVESCPVPHGKDDRIARADDFIYFIYIYVSVHLSCERETFNPLRFIYFDIFTGVNLFKTVYRWTGMCFLKD